jgi:hypothetical protein
MSHVQVGRLAWLWLGQISALSLEVSRREGESRQSLLLCFQRKRRQGY